MLNNYKDQDFYCSFTQLPNIQQVNLDELPYTIHSAYSIDRVRPRTLHRRMTSYTTRPRSGTLDSWNSKTSFPFTAKSSTNSVGSYRSWNSQSTGTSSKRRRRLLSKMQSGIYTMLPGYRKRRSSVTFLLPKERKPSTLDFRCCGTGAGGAGADDDFLRRVSTLSLDLLTVAGATPATPDPPPDPARPKFTAPLFEEPPKVDWKEPDIQDDWNVNTWFAGIRV